MYKSKGIIIFNYKIFGGRLEVRFFFQAVFGVESGVSSVYLDSGLFMQDLQGGGAGSGCVLLLFLLSLGGGKGFFFSFFPVSQCVSMMFPLSS